MFRQFIFLLLFSSFCFGQQWTQKGNTIQGATGDLAGYMDMNATGDIIVVGAPYNSVIGEKAGKVRVLKFQDGAWNQIGQDLFGEATGDSAGLAVAISNDGLTVAFGSRYNKTNGTDSGQVKIYKYDGTTWVQLGQTLNGPDKSYFGATVDFSADGKRVIIGGYFDSVSTQNSGMVQVYDLDGSTWIQVGQTIYGGADSKFGYKVDMNDTGNIFASVSMQGRGKVYQLDGSIWIQTGVFAGSYSSASLNTAGTVVAFGDTFSNDGVLFGGKVNVYKNENNTWNSLGSPFLGTFSFGYFGQGITLNGEGNILAIGTQNINSQVGKVNVYKFYNDKWNVLGNELNGTIANENFGFQMKFSKNGVVLGVGSLNGNVVRAFDYSCQLAAPTADANQQYLAGQTLSDLQVTYTGTLKWFADQGLNTELPNTTLLESGKTYYVLQTTDVCTSAATSITVSEKLAASDVKGDRTKYYPNPIVDQFTIDSKDTIDNVEVYSFMGKLIVAKRISSKTATLNLNTLTSGNYLIKVISAGKVDVIKVIKK
jgi:hypothetical protein